MVVFLNLLFSGVWIFFAWRNIHASIFPLSSHQILPVPPAVMTAVIQWSNGGCHAFGLSAP